MIDIDINDPQLAYDMALHLVRMPPRLDCETRKRALARHFDRLAIERHFARADDTALKMRGSLPPVWLGFDLGHDTLSCPSEGSHHGDR